ncbi:UV excision repair protein Rad23 [Polychaeton citri CBS 116435]|uniref:UV excision repair protein RAD23 n=1 Tax=Polychaeton citri CBS 116435 TaxID=1314669 RepID=A0A9P4Q916_9PEZI|nr:UV excision repair protein Rad23 [Polychaeton citri CBS 116435]
MKLTFKDLKQQKFQIEAEPSETIGTVKEKINKEKGWEPSQQKLIYSGKILQDDQTIESYKIEEKGFIVCMISKPKAVPKPAPSTPAQASSTPAAPPAPPPAAAAAASVTSETQPPATPSPAPASTAGREPVEFNDPSALAMGEQRNAAVANMEAMGFPRDQIDRAMRAAFFNPDRAVEYLLTGIPASAQDDRPAAAPQTPAQGQTQRAPTTGSGNTGGSAGAGSGGEEPVNLFEAAAAHGQRGGGGGGDLTSALGGQGGAQGGAPGGNAGNLDFLRNNPQFQQLRQVVQQQPQMLEPILQQVAAGNPQLAQIITQNPDQFMELLSEIGGDDVPLPPGAQQIAVTEEERDAIERLCRLGFERDMVIQAYFACDKNEELAANFLFDQPDEPDEQ